MDNLMFEWIKNLEASTFRECLKNILDNSLLDPKNRAHTLKSQKSFSSLILCPNYSLISYDQTITQLGAISLCGHYLTDFSGHVRSFQNQANALPEDQRSPSAIAFVSLHRSEAGPEDIRHALELWVLHTEESTKCSILSQFPDHINQES